MNQKEAVFQVVKELKRGDVDTDKPVVLTKQEKQVAAEKLFDGFKKGRVAYNHEMPSDDMMEHLASSIDRKYPEEVGAVFNALQALDTKIRADRYPFPKKVKQSNEVLLPRRKKRRTR